MSLLQFFSALGLLWLVSFQIIFYRSLSCRPLFMCVRVRVSRQVSFYMALAQVSFTGLFLYVSFYTVSFYRSLLQVSFYRSIAQVSLVSSVDLVTMSSLSKKCPLYRSVLYIFSYRSLSQVPFYKSVAQVSLVSFVDFATMSTLSTKRLFHWSVLHCLFLQVSFAGLFLIGMHGFFVQISRRDDEHLFSKVSLLQVSFIQSLLLGLFLYVSFYHVSF